MFCSMNWLRQHDGRATVVRLAGLALLGLAPAAARAWDAEWVDARGRLVRLPLEGGWLECKSEVALAASGWTNVAYLSGASALQSVAGPSGAVWRAALQPETGVTCDVTQRVRPLPDGAELAISAAVRQPNDLAGVYFILHLPSGAFAGGSVVSGRDRLRLPESRAIPYVLGHVNGGIVHAICPGGSARLRLVTPTNAVIQIQDNRRWSDEFALLVPLRVGALSEHVTVEATIEVTAQGRARVSPVEVRVDTRQAGGRFLGFGGNFCYGAKGGLARAVLSSVSPAWGRVQVRLDDLKRSSSRDLRAEFFRQLAAADQPGSELRDGLEIQALLATNQVPCFASTWRAPAWMYAGSGLPLEEGNVVAVAQWPAFAAAVAGYLRYARDRYGFEAEAFSINEPDGGASIRVEADLYPEVMRQLAAEFRQAGLRTRLLLGDVAHPRDAARGYLEPALRDTAALQATSWIGFHSWGGAEADEYAAWAALADRYRLPLAVTEAGVDPDYRHAPVQRHDYAMAEMAQYFKLLRLARPQLVLLWEYSDDYPVLRRNADGRFVSTARWGTQKQWCLCTPPGSLAVACDVSGERADACAFIHGADARGLTIHIGNRLSARVGRVSGLPDNLTALRVVQTTRDDHGREAGIRAVRGGEARIDLPAESMTTLTTLPAPPTRAEQTGDSLGPHILY